MGFSFPFFLLSIFYAYEIQMEDVVLCSKFYMKPFKPNMKTNVLNLTQTETRVYVMHELSSDIKIKIYNTSHLWM